MILIDAYKLRNEIKKSDGYADSEYGKGICAGISRALQKLDEAEIFDLTKHDERIRADERAKVVKEIGNECSNKDLNENIDWCIQTISLFHLTVLDKKRLCETLESQKAMIAMHEAEIQADERQKFAEWLYEKDYLGREDNNPQSFTEHYWQELDVDTVLEQYEKEQK